MEGTADREDHPGNTTAHTKKDQNQDPVSNVNPELEPPPKKRKVERFDLSSHFCDKNVNIFLPEKQLQENILDENSIPANISATKEIDLYMKAIIHDKALLEILMCSRYTRPDGGVVELRMECRLCTAGTPASDHR